MIKNLKIFANTLVWAGINKSDPESSVRRSLILNQMSLFFTVVCSLFVPLFYFVDQTSGAIWAAIVAISYFIPVLFSLNRKFTIGKVWSFLTVTVAAILYSLILGDEFQIQLALYPAGVLPFIYFGRENSKLVYFLFTVATSGYLLAFLFSDSGQELMHAENLGVFIFAIIMIVNSFLMTGMGLYTVNEDARTAEEELKTVNLDKRKLINLLCHDIANPLSLCFLAKSKIYKIEGIGDKEAKNLQRLSVGLSNIKEIIDSVRLIEATEVGKIIVKLEHVNLEDVAKETKVVFEDRLEQKNLKLLILNNLPENCGAIAEGPTLRNNILNNLVSNAIKFSPKNSEIKIELKTHNKSQVLIEVSDQGIGMPNELVNKVFDSHQSTTRKGLDGESGTGFGLPLVKTMVDKFGGNIEIESKEKEEFPDCHGTTFKIYLQKSIENIA